MSRYDLTDFEWRVIGEGEPTGQLRPLQPTIECRVIRRFEAANSTRETDGCAVPRSLTFAKITGRSMSPPLQSSRSSHSRSRRSVERGDLC
jgi:hypothetical protein